MPYWIYCSGNERSKDLEEMKVRDVMNRVIRTCRLGETLPDIADIMAGEDISCVVVVDDSGEAAGIVSALDIVRAFGQKTQTEINATPAEDIMTPLVYNINPGMTLKETANIMVVKGIHRVVVLSEEGRRKPVGLLSATDIVREVRKLKG
jgi:CBS domain-containing protein